MDKENNQEKVSVIIPCFNEVKTVRGVVLATEDAPYVDEIIVVNDGSTDETAKEVADTEAKLINLPGNIGKAGAMEIGVQQARNNLILFLDGDLVNLDHEIIKKIISPVVAGKFDLYVGVLSRKILFWNKIFHFTPILSGKRCLKKDLWEAIPKKFKKGFQIEIAMNYFAKRSGRRMGFELLSRVKMIRKEEKYGIWNGLWRRLGMSLEVVAISFKLYVLRDLSNFFKKMVYKR